VQGNWRARLNWSAGRMRPAGRSLATPGKQQIHPNYVPVDSRFAAIAGFPITQNCGAQQECSVSIKVSKKLHHFNRH